jgi:hypothetical protein
LAPAFAEALLLAHGVTPAVIAELRRDGLATASTRPLWAGARTINVTTLWITAASKVALERGELPGCSPRQPALNGCRASM